MRRYIFTERSGIYIIDLQKTIRLVEEAHDFARRIGARGGACCSSAPRSRREAVSENAGAAGQPYVNHRWLGGLLTNFRTISERIAYLHEPPQPRPARPAAHQGAAAQARRASRSSRSTLAAWPTCAGCPMRSS